MVIHPNSNGNVVNIFKEKERNFENFKYWALGQMKDATPKPQYAVKYYDKENKLI